MVKVQVKNKNMKNLKLTMLSIIILFCSNAFAQTPVAFEKLDAFEKNEIATILKDTNNTKLINTTVDTLKSLYTQCIKIYELQSKDPGLKFYNVKVLGYKYMSLKHLGKLACQTFYKNKKKEFEFLSSKYKDVQVDVAYSKKNDYLDWSEKMHNEVGRYNFNTIQIAYLLGEMKKQLPYALAIDSAYAYYGGSTEQKLLEVFIIDGLIKSNKLEGLDKRIDTKIGYSLKNNLIDYKGKPLVLSELATMLAKNKTSLINIDKTGKISSDFAKYMFEEMLYKNAYELYVEAAKGGYDLPRNKIAVLATALGCWRLKLLDKATVIKNIETLTEYNKTMPIGNSGWKVIVDTYTYLDDKTAAEEAKKNIK
jgi:hypothetical protein